jgi:hypothetical protein
MQPLHTTWIEAIFTRLSGLYGSRFTNMWASVDPELVRKTWATELAGFAERPDAIKYALEHLPEEYPPTALQFRKLCNMKPDETPRLPAPHAPIPDALRPAFEQLGKPPERHDPRAWAKAIVAKHEDGSPVTPTVLGIAKAALKGW